MTIDVETKSDRRLEVEEFKELYRAGGYDSSDGESLLEASTLLRELSNNKEFLGDFIIEELKNGLERQIGNVYGPHNMLLGHATENTMLRANFWPSCDDEEYKQSRQAFIYEMPHDHNFNFLTVGYWGPGYKSRYFEYDYDQLDGLPGEYAGLRETETKVLGPEKIMLYRALLDVHCQLPPESLSVTINIMDITPGFQYHQQYVFDAAAQNIAVVNSARCSSNMYDVAAIMGGEEAKDLLLSISETHDSDYSRFHALRAVVKAEGDPSERDYLLRRGSNAASYGVRAWTDRYIRKLELDSVG